MQFIEGHGIITTKSQLRALLAFTGDAERLDGVGFEIRDGRMLAWASDGHSAVYHHSTAMDGKGGPYAGSHEWQIAADALSRVVKAMENGDEAVLVLSSRGDLREARIREIESGQEKLTISLANHVTNELSLNLPCVVPSRPTPVESPVFQIGLDTDLLARLKRVSAACECSVCRLTLPDDQAKPVHFEIDQMGNLADTGQVAWVGVLMPVRMDAPED